MALQKNLTLDQGADYSVRLEISTSNGSPLDVETYNVKSQMRHSYYSANAVAEFSSTKEDSANGIIILSLTNEQTTLISPGRYYYDVIIKNQSNVITRVLEGSMSVLPSVTR
jgi:hypothetical protein